MPVLSVAESLPVAVTEQLESDTQLLSSPNAKRLRDIAWLRPSSTKII
jgi:hypothetical protein